MESWFLDTEKLKGSTDKWCITWNVCVPVNPASVLLFLKPTWLYTHFLNSVICPRSRVQGELLPPLDYAAALRKGAEDSPTGSQHKVHATEEGNFPRKFTKNEVWGFFSDTTRIILKSEKLKPCVVWQCQHPVVFQCLQKLDTFICI